MSNEELMFRIVALQKEVKKKEDELNGFKKSMDMHLANFPSTTFLQDDHFHYIEKLREICIEPVFEDEFSKCCNAEIKHGLCMSCKEHS